MSQNNDTIYRTTSARTGKMMAIMLGICIVGGAIFFSLWDYWISEPAPVVAAMSGAKETAAPAVATGKTITSDLVIYRICMTLELWRLMHYLENLIIIQQLNANVGDKIIFNVDNDGKSFHSFGVTSDEEGFGGLYPGSEVA